MARIVFTSYMYRYPLGGMLSWAVQYISGFRDLGHEVYVFERASYPGACYDPVCQRATDDPHRGITIVGKLLSDLGLAGRWCFVDYHGNYYGLTRLQAAHVISRADILIDGGNEGAWLHEADRIPRKVLINGEPGYTQIKWENRQAAGEADCIPEYDCYVTNGLLVGTERSSSPTAGLKWYTMPNPVNTSLYRSLPGMPHGPYTTMMNWQSHKTIEYRGITLGQKDVEMEKYLRLPALVETPMLLATAGRVPRDRLEAAGWLVEDAQEKSRSVDAYRNFVAQSKGEWSVAKNVFTELRTGWFSDRSAAYLASGRPVILQDTGFSEALPTGLGLHAFTTLEEAAACIESVDADYAQNCDAAREIAVAYLDSRKLLQNLLDCL